MNYFSPSPHNVSYIFVFYKIKFPNTIICESSQLMSLASFDVQEWNDWLFGPEWK